MERGRNAKRIISVLLAAVMVLSWLPGGALTTHAAEAGLCEHHPAHTPECGYAADAGAPCAFQCAQCAAAMVPETVPETVTETDPETTPETVPETTAETTFETTAEPTSETTAEPTSETTAETTSEPTTETVPETVPEETPSPVQQLQALIAALPAHVTGDNREAVTARLQEIQALYSALPGAEQEQVDMTPCVLLQGELDAANDPQPPAEITLTAELKDHKPVENGKAIYEYSDSVTIEVCVAPADACQVAIYKLINPSEDKCMAGPVAPDANGLCTFTVNAKDYSKTGNIIVRCIESDGKVTQKNLSIVVNPCTHPGFDQQDGSYCTVCGSASVAAVPTPETVPEETLPPVQQLETLIAALPEHVTQDNREAVTAQLQEIQTLYAALTEAEQEQVDMTPCVLLQGELDAASVPQTLEEITLTAKLMDDKPLDEHSQKPAYEYDDTVTVEVCVEPANAGQVAIYKPVTPTTVEIAAGPVTPDANGRCTLTVNARDYYGMGNIIVRCIDTDGATKKQANLSITVNPCTHPGFEQQGDKLSCPFCGTELIAAVQKGSEQKGVAAGMTTQQDFISLWDFAQGGESVLILNNDTSLSLSSTLTVAAGTNLTMRKLSANSIIHNPANPAVRVAGTFKMESGELWPSSNGTGIEVVSGGVLTVTGSTINTTSGDGVIAQSGATVNIFGGEIKTTGNGVIAQDGASVTISGGAINATGNGVTAGNTASVTISGGTIQAGGDGVTAQSGATVSISGGTIQAGRGKTCMRADGGATVRLSGGTYTGAGAYAVSGATIGDLLVKDCAYKNLNTNSLISGPALSNTQLDAPMEVVPIPLKLTLKTPENTQLIQGYLDSGITLETTITAEGTITYQWYQGETAIEDASSPNYTIPAGLTHGSYTYFCEATCEGRTARSDTVTITVLCAHDGEIMDGNCALCGEPMTAQVTSGGKTVNYATFEEAWDAANASGTAQVLLLQSAKLSGPVVVDAGKRITLEMEPDAELSGGFPNGHGLIIVNGTLTMRDCMLMATEITSCIVVSEGGTANIEGRAMSANGGAGIIVNKNGTANITSGTFRGTPGLHVYSGGTATISGGTFVAVDTDSKAIQAIDPSSLLADGLAYQKNGQWLTSEELKSQSISGMVTVHPAPMRITRQPEDVTLTYGYKEGDHQLTVEAVADGDAQIQYQWFYTNINPIGTEATLNIPAAPQWGYYHYYCVLTCGDYTVNSREVTVKVDKAPLTITGATLEEKVYDRDTAATVTGVTFSGFVGDDSLRLGTDFTATAEYDDANAGTDKPATVTVTLNDSDYISYTLPVPTAQATGTVTPKPIEGVTVELARSECLWDGTEQEPAIWRVTYMDGDITEALPADQYAVTYSDNIGPGTGTVTVTGTGNYTFTASATFTIICPHPGMGEDGNCTVCGEAIVAMATMNGGETKYYVSHDELFGTYWPGRTLDITVLKSGTTSMEFMVTGDVTMNMAPGVTVSTSTRTLVSVGDGGVFTLESGTLQANTGSGCVSLRSGTLNIRGGVIKNTGDGNGIYVNSGTVNISGGEVSAESGSGLYVSPSGDVAVNLSGGTFSGESEAIGIIGGTLTVGSLLEDGYAYRQDGTWVTDEATLSGTSLTGTVTVLPIPVKITTQPQENLEVYYGTSQTLSVTTEPAGTPAYQWYEVTTEAPDGSAIDSATEPALNLSQLGVGVHQVFCRVILDGYSEDSSIATVTVLQSGTNLTAESDKTEYAFFDTITVTARVAPTGMAPDAQAPALLTAADTSRLRAEPTAGQVAVYKGDTQVSAPASADASGAYTLTIPARELGAGEHTLTVKFLASDTMAAAEQTLDLITVKERELTVTGGTEGTDYTYEDGVLTIITDAPLTVSMTEAGASTTDRIFVKYRVSANITLSGVNISTSTGAAFEIYKNSTGNVTVTLADGTTNTLRSGANCAGLQKSDGSWGNPGTLTITGSGALNAYGGSNSAGIGGGYYCNSSKIIIIGGNITATGGSSGAGIGGGYSSSGTVTITGGTVTATGGGSGAGIGGGGGYSGSSGTVTISGGTVNATSGNGAGIGGGFQGSGTVIIKGGEITAQSSSSGAGIGGGYRGSGSVTIEGGTVNATGSDGAGIGGGEERSGIVTISGGTVNATSKYGAGIGDGQNGSGSTFNTGTDGHAWIEASGKTTAISDLSSQSDWSGVIFQGSNGQVCKDQTLSAAREIPGGKTLTVPSGVALTIGENVTLTNSGVLTIARGGEITGSGAITGSGTFQTENLTEDMILLPSELVYNGRDQSEAVKAALATPTDTICAQEFQLTGWSEPEVTTTDDFNYTVTYTLINNTAEAVTKTFQLKQSGTSLTAASDKTEYAYNEDITVSVTVTPTGIASDAPAPALLTAAGTSRLRAEPTAGQVAVYADIEGAQTQLGQPQTPDTAGACSFTIPAKDLGAGEHTLTVKYVETASMAPAQTPVTVTVAECTHPTIDADGKCADCGELIVATVEVDGVITNYTDITSAWNFAQGKTATITMLKDQTISETLEMTSGNLTLTMVNGAKLTHTDSGRTFSGRTFWSKGGTLRLVECTIESETITSIFLISNGTVDLTNCNLTANNGNVIDTSVAGKVIIHSGTYFAKRYALGVNNTGTAELYGGSFNGNDKTINIFKGQERTIGGLLADGYAYKKDGKWVTDGAALSGAILTGSVEVFPIPAKITQQPADVSVTYGDSASLTIGAAPADPAQTVTYQWLDQDGNAIDGATGASYTPMGLDVGTYTYSCKVTCDGYPLQSDPVTVTVTPRELTINGAALAAKTYDATTGGTVENVTFDGVVDGESLTLGTDYTAAVEFDTADAGTDKTAAVTVTLTNGNYTFAGGAKEATYTLNGQTIGQKAITPTVTLAETSLVWDGSELKPAVTVTCTEGGETLTLPEDEYTAEYTDNVVPGKATVTVTGTKNYSFAPITAQFTITCPHPDMDADGKCTVCHADIVATATVDGGETKYYVSIDELFKAVFGETGTFDIMVLKGGDISRTLYVDGSEKITMRMKPGVTVSTSGKTLVSVVNGGVFTLESGTLQTATTKQCLHVSSGSTVNIRGGAIKNTGSGDGIRAADGTLNISGGEVSAASGSGLCVSPNFSGDVITVNLSGGIFSGGRNAIEIENCDATLGSILVDDYAYRQDGVWVTDETVLGGKNLTGTVTVLPIPVKITGQPESAQTVFAYPEDEAPELTVTAEGTGVTYQWYQVGETDTAVDGGTGATLTVPTGLAEGEHQFYCVVTCDGYTENSANATVTVTPCPHEAATDGVCDRCHAVIAATVEVDGVITNYTDIVSAWNFAHGKTATITMLKDQTISQRLEMTSGNLTLTMVSGAKLSGDRDLIFVNGGKLTLDGCNLEVNSRSVCRCLWVVNSSAVVDIINCSMTSNSRGGYAVSVVEGTVNIHSGTFQGQDSLQAYGLYVHEGSDAKANLYGGTFTGTTKAIWISSSSQTLRNLLMDGYAYKTASGWLSGDALNQKEITETVTVLPIPVKITRQPADVSVTYGDSASLTVEAAPADPAQTVTYQWLDQDGNAINGATGASYTPMGLDVGTYTYSCKVTCDGYTLQSDSVTVTVGQAQLPEMEHLADVTYNGTEQKPTVTVTGLTEHTDYEVLYTRSGAETADFTNAGEITITVTGMGNYTGTATGTFTIAKAEITDVSATANSVNAPEAQRTAQTTVTGGSDYTAAIAWTPADSQYGFNTAYTATLILTPDENHRFGVLRAEGWTVTVGEDGAAKLSKTFPTTRKEKLTSLTALENVTLMAHTNKDGVIVQLPKTVTATTETRRTLPLTLNWSCEDFDPAPNAGNTFYWTAACDESLDANNVTLTGSITVTNPDALSVSITGTDKTVTYDGSAIDVSTLFTIGENAGMASYSVTGDGTLEGSSLTVNKAGIFTITVHTEAQGVYAAGEASATLTVNPKTLTPHLEGVTEKTYDGTTAAPAGLSIKLDGIVEGDDVTASAAAYSYDGSDAGDWTITATEITLSGTAAGCYTLSEATATAAGTIQQAALTITASDQIITYGGSIAQGTDRVTADGLVSGDTLESITLSASTTDVPGGTITPSAAAVKNGGNDVTANYDVTYQTGKLTVERLPIPAPTAASLTYNGQEQTGVASGTGYTLEGHTAVNAGDYTATATPDGNHCWEGGSIEAKQIAWSIAPARMENIQADGYTGIYDGQAHGITVTDYPTGVTAQYGTADGTYDLAENPTYTDAGAYTVYYRLTSPNYETVTGCATVTIERKAITHPTAKMGLIYNGQEQTGVEAGEGYTLRDAAAKNAGNYTATAALDANHKWSDGKTEDVSVSWAIGKKEITVSITADGGVYSGEPFQASAQPEGTAEGETVPVTLTYTAQGEATGSAAAPTDVGSYTVTAAITDGNYELTGVNAKDFTIAPASIGGAEVTADGAYTYTGAEQTPEPTVTLNGKTLVKDTDYTVSYADNIDAGNAKITVTGMGNYTGEAVGEFIIAKAKITDVSATVNSVNVPKAQGTAQTAVTGGSDYTAAITWTPVDSTYGFNTAYTATLTLTPDENHRFGVLRAEGWTVTVGEDGAAKLSKTFPTTRKEKLMSLTAPENVILMAHTNKDGVIVQLPKTVTATTETRRTLPLTLNWSCEDFDPAPNAGNTFLWTAVCDESLDANNVTLTGSITVTNPDALSVSITGTDKTVTYDGSAIDVSTLFTIGENAGMASYSVTGDGTLEGSSLTVRKAGTFTVTVHTAANGSFGAGMASATLTVNKGVGHGSVAIAGWTYGDAAQVPIPASATNGVEGVTYGYTLNGVSVDQPGNAGTYTLTAAFPATGLYESCTATVEFTVGKKAVTAAVSANDKTYDGTTDAALTATVDTGVEGETLTVTGLTGSFENANVGSGKTVTVNAGSVSYGGSANSVNYAVTIPAAVKANITPAKVSAPTAFTGLTYSGQPQTGVAAGEGYTLSGNTATDAGSYEATATPDGNHCWEGGSTEAKTIPWSIAPKDVTVDITASGGTYSGEPFPAQAVIVENAAIPVTLVYAPGDSVPKDAGTYTVTASIQDGNYRLTGQTSKIFTIAKADPMLSVSESVRKTYGDADFRLDAAQAGDGALLYSSSDENVAAVDELGNVRIAGAGTATVTVSSAETNNYLPGSKTVTVEVQKATAGVTAEAIPEKTYGDQEFTIRYTQSTPGTVSFVSADPSVATVDESGQVRIIGAGATVITLSMAESENYTAAEAKVTLTVKPKTLTVTVIPGGGVFGQTITGAEAKVEGLAEDEQVDVTLVYTREGETAGSATVPTEVGTYTVTASVSDPNYILEGEFTAQFLVRQPITVRIEDVSKTYGEEDPSFHYEIAEGSVIDGKPLEIQLERTAGEDAGSYAITAPDAVEDNPSYAVTVVEGKLTVEPRDIEDAQVVLGPALTANGQEQTQTLESVTVTIQDKIVDVTYTVEGNTAAKAGGYAMTIQGTGNFAGTLQQSFAIAPAAGQPVEADSSGNPVLGAGKITVQVETDAPVVQLLTPKVDLVEELVQCGDITSQELAQVAAGTEMKIVLEITDGVSQTEQEQISDYAVEILGSQVRIGSLFDIRLYKQQDGEIEWLHETKETIRLTIQVPTDLINTNRNITRTFWIVRCHDGNTEFLPTRYNYSSRTLSFETDRFSGYAIVYKDAKSSGNNQNTGTGDVPRTGDSSPIELCFTVMALSAAGICAMIAVKRKKQRSTVQK